jgi:hypothetical protein
MYSKNIPIFSMPFWLDNIAENWEVILYEKENKIVAALPFCLKGKPAYKTHLST